MRRALKVGQRRNLTSIKRSGGGRTTAKLKGCMVMIWSNQWCAWWRENGQGYTDGMVAPPWVLPFEDAYARTKHCGPEKGIQYEVAPKALGDGA